MAAVASAVAAVAVAAAGNPLAPIEFNHPARFTPGGMLFGTRPPHRSSPQSPQSFRPISDPPPFSGERYRPTPDTHLMQEFAVLGRIGLPNPGDGLGIWAARHAHREARRQGDVLVDMIRQGRSLVRAEPVIWNPNPDLSRTRIDIRA